MPRRQCAKCPWKVTTDPHEIPNGYSVEKHYALSRTVARPADLSPLNDATIRVMACHETAVAMRDDDHPLPCVGWLANPLGEGNNLALRMLALRGKVNVDFELEGEQHSCFEDTLPNESH